MRFKMTHLPVCSMCRNMDRPSWFVTFVIVIVLHSWRYPLVQSQDSGQILSDSQNVCTKTVGIQKSRIVEYTTTVPRVYYKTCGSFYGYWYKCRHYTSEQVTKSRTEYFSDENIIKFCCEGYEKVAGMCMPTDPVTEEIEPVTEETKEIESVTEEIELVTEEIEPVTEEIEPVTEEIEPVTEETITGYEEPLLQPGFATSQTLQQRSVTCESTDMFTISDQLTVYECLSLKVDGMRLPNGMTCKKTWVPAMPDKNTNNYQLRTDFLGLCNALFIKHLRSENLSFDYVLAEFGCKWPKEERIQWLDDTWRLGVYDAGYAESVQCVISKDKLKEDFTS